MTQENLRELWDFRKNIILPNLKVEKYNYSYRKEHWIRLGTYVKPLARIIGRIARIFGYKISYRGRGRRSGKDYNAMTRDIRVDDSLFLAVYAKKSLS